MRFELNSLRDIEVIVGCCGEIPVVHFAVPRNLQLSLGLPPLGTILEYFCSSLAVLIELKRRY